MVYRWGMEAPSATGKYPSPTLSYWECFNGILDKGKYDRADLGSMFEKGQKGFSS